MIDLFQIKSRLFSFFRNLLGISRYGNSADERRGNGGNPASFVHPSPPLNGGAGDFSDLRQIIAELQAASAKSMEDLAETLRALAGASEKLAPYTRGHSERVTRFSVEIARIMGLPDEEIERIRIGALAHDIGKIMIDHSVLNKPALLTSSEYALMQTHAIRGAELLKDIPQMREILPGIQSHHEQLDGKGYPQGLRGDKIPVIARIITVADCFDAMITARPYQTPATVEHALETMRSGIGIKFDARVVEALSQGVQNGSIRVRFEDRMKP